VDILSFSLYQVFSFEKISDGIVTPFNFKQALIFSGKKLTHSVISPS
jgi:hypothetical protein